jgi:hypothetical protein
MRTSFPSGEERMPSPKRLLTGVLLFACVAQADTARGDGALAVGQPADVGRQGIAIGWAVEYGSKQAAEAEALARCRAFRDAPQSTRDLCRIVESVRDACLAVALDPDPGTIGVGWGVHPNKEWAEDTAMDKCAETSAPKRRESCRVAFTRCDGR